MHCSPSCTSTDPVESPCRGYTPLYGIRYPAWEYKKEHVMNCCANYSTCTVHRSIACACSRVPSLYRPISLQNGELKLLTIVGQPKTETRVKTHLPKMYMNKCRAPSMVILYYIDTSSSLFKMYIIIVCMNVWNGCSMCCMPVY